MTNEQKHTRGPWRVEQGTTLVWGACNPDDNTTYGMGYPIVECRVSPASQWAATKGPSFDEGEANARLIAAAPDLLAALKALAEEAHRNMVGGAGHLVDEAFYAIAKAEAPVERERA